MKQTFDLRDPIGHTDRFHEPFRHTLTSRLERGPPAVPEANALVATKPGGHPPATPASDASTKSPGQPTPAVVQLDLVDGSDDDTDFL